MMSRRKINLSTFPKQPVTLVCVCVCVSSYNTMVSYLIACLFTFFCGGGGVVELAYAAAIVFLTPLPFWLHCGASHTPYILAFIPFKEATGLGKIII